MTLHDKKKLCSFLSGVLITSSLFFFRDNVLMTQGYIEFLAIFQTNIQNPKIKHSHNNSHYVPSPTEQYILDHMVQLGYANPKKNARTCDIWYDPIKTNTSSIHPQLMAYMQDLERYNALVENFIAIPDLLPTIQQTQSHDICRTTRPHPNGLPLRAIFQNSQQLSYSSNAGYLEPLLPPLRHPIICQGHQQQQDGKIIKRKNILNLNYLVHDFEAMCQTLQPHSKRILIDLGASLKFHQDGSTPILHLLNLYEKFGFHFEHIYAFELTTLDPNLVYQRLLPEKYIKSYHWINTGAVAKEGHRLNPLHSILRQFHEDDLIVLKIDMDAPDIELDLVMQLLEGKDGIYYNLVDQLYFEHHVNMFEMKPWWREDVNGTVKDSFDLFHALRKKGIGAHSWV